MEAIDLAVCIDDLLDRRARLQGELRDYFAHECQIYGYKNGCDSLMKNFFDEIFKDIPPWIK